MKIQVQSQFEDVKSLSVFTKIDESELHKILKSAYIKNYKKNEILLHKDDKALNFYIVLSGAVKLSVTNEEGQEAILQIVKSGDFVGDLSGKTFIADAEIIENASILAIPAEKFRENIKLNSQLALNFLEEILVKNRDFIHQSGQLKIASAKEKVGQFLLYSAFKKGYKKDNRIDLECDKKVIASYLGIRSETFSRILKKLEDEGEIAIEKNKIILLKERSLCSYCDSEISAKCSKHNPSFCD